jgi:23S rRNA pseudouridine2605 synthase
MLKRDNSAPKREHKSDKQTDKRAPKTGGVKKKEFKPREDKFNSKGPKTDSRKENSFDKKSKPHPFSKYTKETKDAKAGKTFVKPEYNTRKPKSEFDAAYDEEMAYSGPRKFSKAVIRKTIPAVKIKKASAPSDNEGVRLNKYIANAGICSRREADTMITTGVVKINGKIVTELGVRVMPGDEVRFNDEKINPERKVYILLNKPKDYVTTLDDPEGRRTVMDLIKEACSERVYPVGRLDRNTTGLLLLTNDGELTKKLTHPKHNKKKIYHVEIDKPLLPEHFDQISQGIELEDGFIAVDAISYVDNIKTEIGVELHSGRNRIVRRILEHFGYNIKRLDRVVFAGLTKLNLPRGKWRFLTEKEIIRLQTGMYD